MELRRASALLKISTPLRISTAQLQSRAIRQSAHFSTSLRWSADSPSMRSDSGPTATRKRSLKAANESASTASDTSPSTDPKTPQPADTTEQAEQLEAVAVAGDEIQGSEAPIEAAKDARRAENSPALNSLIDDAKELSTLELVNRAFASWKDQRLMKTTQKKIDEALSVPRRRDDSLPKFGAGVPTPGSSGYKSGFGDNPFASMRSTETALQRWNKSVEAMDKSLHLGLKTGRQLEVFAQNSADLGIKLRMLGSLVGRNQIRQDERKQQFHERPGLKRKRLKRERWRRRFANSFRQICMRATELARQGW